MAQLEHIEAIERRLWTAADTLRANSRHVRHRPHHRAGIGEAGGPGLRSGGVLAGAGLDHRRVGLREFGQTEVQHLGAPLPEMFGWLRLEAARASPTRTK